METINILLGLDTALRLVWAGSAEQLWQYFQEVSTPFHARIQAIPAARRAQIDGAACAALARFQSGDAITVPVQVVLTTGGRCAAERDAVIFGAETI